MKNMSKVKSIGHYTLGSRIGSGTFGYVRRGVHSLTSATVAVKILEKKKICDSSDIERVSREIHILKMVRNPHVIQLYEIIETSKQLYLIMEFASGKYHSRCLVLLFRR
jgi:5'-AMP-activated protein kinase catalytic alpha subunit